MSLTFSSISLLLLLLLYPFPTLFPPSEPRDGIVSQKARDRRIEIGPTTSNNVIKSLPKAGKRRVFRGETPMKRPFPPPIERSVGGGKGKGERKEDARVPDPVTRLKGK